MKLLRMRITLMAALGTAILWVWWRRRIEELWKRPQHAPLSAEWLYSRQATWYGV